MEVKKNVRRSRRRQNGLNRQFRSSLFEYILSFFYFIQRAINARNAKLRTPKPFEYYVHDFRILHSVDMHSDNNRNFHRVTWLTALCITLVCTAYCKSILILKRTPKVYRSISYQTIDSCSSEWQVKWQFYHSRTAEDTWTEHTGQNCGLSSSWQSWCHWKRGFFQCSNKDHSKTFFYFYNRLWSFRRLGTIRQWSSFKINQSLDAWETDSSL